MAAMRSRWIISNARWRWITRTMPAVMPPTMATMGMLIAINGTKSRTSKLNMGNSWVRLRVGLPGVAERPLRPAQPLPGFRGLCCEDCCRGRAGPENRDPDVLVQRLAGAWSPGNNPRSTKLPSRDETLSPRDPSKASMTLPPGVRPEAAGMADERRLIARAQSGDTAAFRTLVERHQARAHALALRILRSPSDAEEVAQDAFVRVWTALPGFRGESSFGTWLYRIVARRAF